MAMRPYVLHPPLSTDRGVTRSLDTSDIMQPLRTLALVLACIFRLAGSVHLSPLGGHMKLRTSSCDSHTSFGWALLLWVSFAFLIFLLTPNATSGQTSTPPVPSSLVSTSGGAAGENEAVTAAPDLLHDGIPAPIHGVTVADDYDIRTWEYLDQVIPALTNLAVTPTVRLTFTLEVDSGLQGAVASTYISPVEEIKAAIDANTDSHPFIMGQPVDSSYMFCFNEADHAARWRDYVNTLGRY